MPSLSDLRKVANINTLDWELLEDECKDQDGDIWWYNLSYNFETGEGSYLYKMGPNTVSKAHSHTGPEEFFILEGDLTDSDGFTYKKGDFVHLGPDSKHFSTTVSGCTSVVTHRGKFIYTDEN